MIGGFVGLFRGRRAVDDGGGVKVASLASRGRSAVAGWVCPACHGPLRDGPRRLGCRGCGRAFPVVAGLVDLRLAPDRYLSIEAERAKARRLARLEPGTDAMGLAAAYYAITDDVDRTRRARYLMHLARAELRGAALADQLPAAGRILEIGCGSGGLLTALASRGRTVEGVDIALRWLVLARRRLADRGLRVPLVGACAEALPYRDGAFTAVVADSVLEHLDDPLWALREWARVVRPGGRLVLWSPNRLSLAADPHVGLWGVGWLPPGLATAYVRLRRDCAWTVRPLSAARAALLAAEAGWTAIRTTAPALPEALGASPAERLALRAYQGVRSSRAGARALRTFGPLWQLVAVRGPA